MWGSGFGAWGSVFGFSGSGVRCRILDLGFGVYVQGFRVKCLGVLVEGHPGVNLGENQSISHRCHPILVAFVWE